MDKDFEQEALRFLALTNPLTWLVAAIALVFLLVVAMWTLVYWGLCTVWNRLYRRKPEQGSSFWGATLPAPRPLTPERRQAILEAEKQGLSV